ETLHKHHLEGVLKGNNEPELGSRGRSVQENDKKETIKGKQVHKKSLLKNRPVMSSILVYCVFSLHDIAYSEIFSLWAVSPKEYGGLSFTTSDVGVVLAIT
ncbi:hypothetical protein KI387_040060, partial [Taxus chinensis]